MTRAANWFIIIGLLFAGILLTHYAPPTEAQFTSPALPNNYTDIATPATNPPPGATRVYTKAGTVCALNPSGTETCTGSGGGTVVSVAAPYITVAGTKYVMATGWPFTAFPSLSALDGNTCTLTAGTNGSENVSCALNNTNAWYSEAATTSIEGEFQGLASANGLTGVIVAGFWLCDTTNNRLYSAEEGTAPSGVALQYWIQVASWTLSGCAGTPSSPVSVVSFPLITNSIVHLKMAKVSTNVVTSISQDAGQTYTTLDTRAAGTISKGGIELRTTVAQTVDATFLSVVVN